MTWSRLDLGVGVIALGALDQLWEGIGDLVDVVEVEPQTLWEGWSGGDRKIAPGPLRWLRSCGRPLLAHGVGYPVGGTTPPDEEGVRAAARSARDLHAVHWSEHLAFNVVAGSHAGFLLPPVQSEEGVRAAVRHIGQYQERYDRPFLVETPTNYLRPVPGDLDDGEYVASVAEGADCGILLDLHNVWTNERNGRQRVVDHLAQLPLERVWEVHLAGGFETGGYYLDAHIGAIDPELLALARDVVPLLPRVRAVVYEAVPASMAAQGVEGLRRVLEGMHELVDLPAVDAVDAVGAVGAGSARTPVSTGARMADGGATARREAELLAFTTRASDRYGPEDRGAELIRALTNQARLSLLAGEHTETLTALLEHLGVDATEEVLDDFLAAAPASAWPEEQGRHFADWLAGRPELLASTLAPATTGARP